MGVELKLRDIGKAADNTHNLLAKELLALGEQLLEALVVATLCRKADNIVDDC